MLKTKEILSEGKFRNGQTEWSFNAEEIKEIANTANEIVADGYKITAPFYHEEAAIPVVSAEDLSYKNGGFWSNFRTKVNDKGKTVLVGDLDIKDEDTYKKVGETIQQTSIRFKKEHLGTSNNKTYKNALLHVALVNNAIEAGQENFKEPDKEFAISMAQMVVEDKTGEEEVDGEEIDYTIIVQGLREHGIAIDVSGGQELTCDTLCTLLSNFFSSEKDLKTMTKDTETKDQVLMAQEIETLKTQLGEKDTKIANLTKDSEILMSNLLTNKKAGIKARANRLQAVGTLEKEAVQNVFLSKLTDTITMAQCDSLESQLSTLELVPVKNKPEDVKMAGLIGTLEHLTDFTIPNTELDDPSAKEMSEEEIAKAWGYKA